MLKTQQTEAIMDELEPVTGGPTEIATREKKS